jgi:hypothetical protein
MIPIENSILDRFITLLPNSNDDKNNLKSIFRMYDRLLEETSDNFLE